MDDLVTWLRAQLDEDERVARECGDYGRWRVTSDGNLADNSGTIALGPWDSPITDADHIARWDPTRVLAEVDAKRQIVGQAQTWIKFAERQVAEGRIVAEAVRDAYLTTLELLALPYADRVGYRQEWRPAT